MIVTLVAREKWEENHNAVNENSTQSVEEQLPGHFECSVPLYQSARAWAIILQWSIRFAFSETDLQLY